ncbi:hypothetical protein JCM12294_07610 [Desulfocicer niacini]
MLTDVNVTKLTVQTDHKQCGLEKWLYSDTTLKTGASDSILGGIQQIKAPCKGIFTSLVICIIM